MGHWLITRAEPGASLTARRLASVGAKGFVAPVLEIQPLAQSDLDPADADALAFTSATGVAQFAKRRTERDLQVYAVGDATAAAALGMGFAKVASASGDVAALAQLILTQRPEKVLHISGEDQSGDLAAVLSGAGVPTERRVAYRAAPIAALARSTMAAIEIGEIQGALFHSPRGAQVFAELLPERLRPALAKMVALTLSDAIANAASTLPWGRIGVAERPNEDALLRLLGSTVAKA